MEHRYRRRRGAAPLDNPRSSGCGLRSQARRPRSRAAGPSAVPRGPDRPAGGDTRGSRSERHIAEWPRRTPSGGYRDPSAPRGAGPSACGRTDGRRRQRPGQADGGFTVASAQRVKGRHGGGLMARRIAPNRSHSSVSSRPRSSVFSSRTTSYSGPVTSTTSAVAVSISTNSLLSCALAARLISRLRTATRVPTPIGSGVLAER